MNLDDLKKKLLERPNVCAVYDTLAEEFSDAEISIRDNHDLKSHF